MRNRGRDRCVEKKGEEGRERERERGREREREMLRRRQTVLEWKGVEWNEMAWDGME